MGLDITAHRKIAPMDLDGAEGDDRYDAAYNAGGFIAYLNPDFPGRANELVDRGAYRPEQSLGFRAGSYVGYNNWREQLAKLAGYPLTAAERHGTTEYRHDQGAWASTEGPFWELINFSDCEGTIGAAVSAKLAQDFAEFQPKVDALDGPDADWFRAKYAEWRTAFEMAADGGCVEFH